MGGRSSQRKGANFERSIVHAFSAFGLKARRVPLSGAVGGEFQDDVLVDDATGRTHRLECKKRKTGSGFKTLYDWLQGADGLVVARDRDEALVVIRLKDYAELLGGSVESSEHTA